MAIPSLGGAAFIKVDGTQYQLLGSLKIDPGGPVNTPVAGADQSVHGFTTKYEPPEIEFDVSDSGGLSIQQMRGFSGGTVTMELGNGKVYLLESGFTIDKTSLDAIAGKVTWKLSGLSCQEITA